MKIINNIVMLKIKIYNWLHDNKRKIYAGIFLIVLGFGFYGFYKVNQFFETHKFVFQSPVIVHMQKPIYITTRILQVVQVVQAADDHVNPLTPDEQYACDKFGKDCTIALAIMRSESHFRPNAINRNKDGSWDFGCWQINSVHLSQIDTSKVNLLNCHDSTDVAYTLYKQDKGFSAWVSYTTGIYKQFLLQ